MASSPYDIFTDPASYGAGTYAGSGAYSTPGLTGVTPASIAAISNVPVPTPKPAEIGPWGADINNPLNTKGWVPPGSGGGGGGGSDGFQFGFNPSSLNMIMSGLGTIGGLWQAYEDMKLRKETLNLQKGSFNKNYLNAVEAYNTNAEDRILNRVRSGGWTQEQGAKWLAAHKLDKTPL